jgi:putative phage-type endonuclease
MQQALKQRSPEWLEWRKSHIGSSEAPVIMGESPYMTLLELYREKKGLESKDRSSWATEKGNYFEPKARALYELLHDREMPEAIFVHPVFEWMSASLDGWCEDEQIILEIKVPGREVFEMAKAGKVHHQYVWQLEHQLFVTGAKEVHFWCVRTDGGANSGNIIESVLVVYRSDPEKRGKLIEYETEFWGMIKNNIEPDPEERDIVERRDPLSIQLFMSLRDATTKLEQAAKYLVLLEEAHIVAKQEVVSNMIHPKEQCAGVIIKKTKNKRKNELDKYDVKITN